MAVLGGCSVPTCWSRNSDVSGAIPALIAKLAGELYGCAERGLVMTFARGRCTFRR